MSQRTEIERAINLFIDAINRNDASQIHSRKMSLCPGR